MRRATALLVVVISVVALGVAGGPASPSGALLRPRTFAEVSTEFTFRCGRATDHTIWCWGDNSSNIIGPTGVRQRRYTLPEQVRLTGTPLAGKAIRSITTGDSHVCALATDGTVACWGSNSNGELGIGTTSDYVTTPTALKTSGTPFAGKTIVELTAGFRHMCGRASDGTIACWGQNIDGVLGINNTGIFEVRSQPTAVYRGSGSALAGRTVTGIQSGDTTVCATTTSGVAACWGQNGSGGLGDGTTVSKAYPVAVVTAGTPLAGASWSKVVPATAASSTCGITTGGQAACWGTNLWGRLGNGSTVGNSTTPVRVAVAGTVLGGKTIVQIAGGETHTCALAADNSVACWGYNGSAVIGVPVNFSGQNTTFRIPTAVTRTGTALAGVTVTQISMARGGSCIRGSDGRIACWGLINRGLPGDGTDTSSGVGDYRARAVIGTGPVGVYASNAALTDDVFRTMIGRAPTSSERSTWVTRLDARTHTPGDLAASLRASTDHANNVDPVARLYWAYFVRTPDAPGLKFWISEKRRGRSVGAISASFAASREFTERYGSLTNRQFVELIYRNVLNRAPDPTGTNFWTAELDARRRTRGQVMQGFSESAENKTRQTNPVHAAVLYIQLLDRAPTTSELNGVVNRLKAGGKVSVEAQRIMDTNEYILAVLARR